jgi:hypothetical protein
VSSRIGKKDPEGYYVVVARRGIEPFLEGLGDIRIDMLGDKVVIRTRSRNTALRILEIAEKKGLCYG